MSLNAMMSTGVSGMTAFSTRLAAISDNVANSATVGYKRSDAEFSTLVIGDGAAGFNPGGTLAQVRRMNGEQGALTKSGSSTDLAVNGSGFFAVADASGQPFLTRAGAFRLDNAGELVNAAGFRLLGYPLDSAAASGVTNSFTGLVPVNVGGRTLEARPSRTGELTVNLPASSTIIDPADLPSANTAGATVTSKSSLVAYDTLGAAKTLDIYWSKTAADTWEVAVYDRADADPAAVFPYGSAPLTTQTLTFDPSSGRLDPSSPSSISLTVPGGKDLAIDLSGTTQLATGFSVLGSKIDGNAPSAIEGVTVLPNGQISGLFADGSTMPLYRVPLATVPSPENLIAQSGNVYSVGPQSGELLIAEAGVAGLGSITSGALESSNVDLSEELTAMIESQRNYTANSKVFQTGAELLEILVNLKR